MHLENTKPIYQTATPQSLKDAWLNAGNQTVSGTELQFKHFEMQFLQPATMHTSCLKDTN